MPTRTPTPKPKRKPQRLSRPRPNYELLDQRRAVREQRELVKLTRKLRRDLATHRRELRMLLMDLTRMFQEHEPADADVLDAAEQLQTSGVTDNTTHVASVLSR